jgi:hypothetical protein
MEKATYHKYTHQLLEHVSENRLEEICQIHKDLTSFLDRDRADSFKMCLKSFRDAISMSRGHGVHKDEAETHLLENYLNTSNVFEDINLFGAAVLVLSREKHNIRLSTADIPRAAVIYLLNVELEGKVKFPHALIAGFLREQNLWPSADRDNVRKQFERRNIKDVFYVLEAHSFITREFFKKRACVYDVLQFLDAKC